MRQPSHWISVSSPPSPLNTTCCLHRRLAAPNNPSQVTPPSPASSPNLVALPQFSTISGPQCLLNACSLPLPPPPTTILGPHCRNRSRAFDLSVLPLTPSLDKDVEMPQCSQSPASHSLPSTPINLPRYLARPDYREILKEAIAAVDPILKDVNMDCILDGLEVLRPRSIPVLYSLSTLC
jgi:hypothetical protein